MKTGCAHPIWPAVVNWELHPGPETDEMAAIRIRTTLESETLTLPELRPLIGKTVEIQVVERKPRKPRRRKPAEPVPTLEEVRAMLSHIPGKLSDFVIEMRAEERY